MKEIFKDIKEYEGLYQVSNLGRIKSLKRKVNSISRYGKKYEYIIKEKIVKQIMTGVGYWQVNLTKNSVQKCFHTHRIIAKHFLTNNQNKPQINHIDGDKKNNQLSNLEWVTASENSRHAHRIGLSRAWQKGNRSSNTPSFKTVIQMDLEGKEIKEWLCGLDAVREGGFESSCISRCCQNKAKFHRGYKWKYKK